jgi:hypothetical protein
MKNALIIAGILLFIICKVPAQVGLFAVFNNYKEYCDYKYPSEYSISVNDNIQFLKKGEVFLTVDYLKFEKQKLEELQNTGSKSFEYLYDEPAILLKSQGLLLKHMNFGYDGPLIKRTKYNYKGEIIYDSIDGVLSPDQKYIINIPTPDLDDGQYYTNTISFNNQKDYILEGDPGSFYSRFSSNSDYFAVFYDTYTNNETWEKYFLLFNRSGDKLVDVFLKDFGHLKGFGISGSGDIIIATIRNEDNSTKIKCLKIENGILKELWSKRADRIGFDNIRFSEDDKNVLVVCPGRYIYCIEIQSGKVIWENMEIELDTGFPDISVESAENLKYTFIWGYTPEFDYNKINAFLLDDTGKIIWQINDYDVFQEDARLMIDFDEDNNTFAIWQAVKDWDSCFERSTSDIWRSMESYTESSRVFYYKID